MNGCNVIGTRKTRSMEDILIYTDMEENLNKVYDKIIEKGYICDKILGRRKKIIIVGINADDDEQLILTVVNKNTGTEDTRMIFCRNGYASTKTACVELTEEAAIKLLDKERVRIGWTHCRVRDYIDERKCSKCGAKTHLAWNCKFKEKVCFKCKGRRHEERNCERQEIGFRDRELGLKKVTADTER